jgi:two-component system, OmpR family, sensor histidine kinase VicK
VTIETRKENRDVAIAIIDTGIGIDKKDMSKLYDPFFQVKNDTARKQRGTGLGLPIAKGLVEAHGGKIVAESAGLWKGSTFTFTLPIMAVQDA